MKLPITALAFAILISASTFIGSADDGVHRQVSQYCVPQDSDEPQNASHKIYCQQRG
jgi:hypothetical protein